jgi:Flp pilus assembly protein TadG
MWGRGTATACCQEGRSQPPGLSSARSRRDPSRRHGAIGDGQTLTEFALVLPLFILLLIAVVEFALMFNAFLGINFATRDASLVGAEAGNSVDADCLILQTVEDAVGAPADRARITQVRIYKATQAGAPTGAVTLYLRTGSTTCLRPNGVSLTVPYTISANGYPVANRCNVLAGCNGGPQELDQIGVEVTYVHRWITGFGAAFGGSNGQLTLVKGNVMRLEPVL